MAFLLQTFSRTAVVVDFYANQPYIAKNLCENRDKPKMKCGGKCQLMKKLAAEEQKGKDGDQTKVISLEVLSSKSFYAVLSFSGTTLLLPFYPTYSEDTHAGQAPVFFHPPDGSATV